jgi:hypothetical protein
VDGVWTISVEYTREEDGVPRTTGGRQQVTELLLQEAVIDAAALVGGIAGKVYTDVREAMMP